MSTHPEKPDSGDSPSFDLVVAAALWIGAVCLVVAVDYGAAHGVNHQLYGLFVVLHQFYGKWVIAGMAVLVGLGMSASALRRMQAAPKPPQFLRGVVVLESLRWFRQPPPKSRRSA